MVRPAATSRRAAATLSETNIGNLLGIDDQFLFSILIVLKMKTRSLYTKPSITKLEVPYATDAATNGWGKNVTHTFSALRISLNITWV